MRQKSSNRIHTDIPLIILASLVLLAQPSRNAVAEDLLGLYVGGAIGQSHVEATGQTIYALGNVYYDTGSFKENHLACKGMVGIRPISLLGAEVSYADFGHPTGAFNAYPADESMKGVSAFAVLYLPVPIVDVFLKAGVARIQSELNGTGHGGPNCSANSPCPEYVFIAPFQLNRTNTGGAGGVGAQYKFSSLAVRTEYERFNAAGGKPSLLSVGVTWTFF
jgi:Outer membrane protein beta-barrel domain